MKSSLLSPLYGMAAQSPTMQSPPPCKTLRRDASNQIDRARAIRRSLGIKVAARYLRKRGWSLEAALYILLGK